jgi:carbon-monoxide dehydrogenase large subunit
VNPLGAKGVGEAGTLGSTPCIVNAAVDALSPFGVTHVDMMLRPEKLWRLVHSHRSHDTGAGRGQQKGGRA